MKLISVDEGTTVNVDVKGYRVAYSCYGRLSALNGEPETDIIIKVSTFNFTIYTIIVNGFTFYLRMPIAKVK